MIAMRTPAGLETREVCIVLQRQGIGRVMPAAEERATLPDVELPAAALAPAEP